MVNLTVFVAYAVPRPGKCPFVSTGTQTLGWAAERTAVPALYAWSRIAMSFWWSLKWATEIGIPC